MKSPSGEVPSELFVRDRLVFLCTSSLLGASLVKVRKDSSVGFANGSRLESTARRFKRGDVMIVESVLRVLEPEINTGQNCDRASHRDVPSVPSMVDSDDLRTPVVMEHIITEGTVN